MTNELFELAAKRRSIRRYTNDHISDDVLNEIMKVALAAPCSFGHRPVEFVIVRDKNRIIELITERRKSRDLSLDDMGNILHVSGRTVRRWERGEQTPTIDDVINLCNEFDIILGLVGFISVIGQVEKNLQTKKSGICLMFRTVMLS